MSSEEGNYRIRLKAINAFKWSGDLGSVPAWAKLIVRNMQFNEATDPPGLIMETLKSGSVHVPYGGWFVYHVDADIALARTDDTFKKIYEPNT